MSYTTVYDVRIKAHKRKAYVLYTRHYIVAQAVLAEVRDVPFVMQAYPKQGPETL